MITPPCVFSPCHHRAGLNHTPPHARDVVTFRNTHPRVDLAPRTANLHPLSSRRMFAPSPPLVSREVVLDCVVRGRCHSFECALP